MLDVKADFLNIPKGIYLDTLSKGIQPNISLENQLDALHHQVAIRGGIYRSARMLEDLFETSKKHISSILPFASTFATLPNADFAWKLIVQQLLKTYPESRIFANLMDHHSLLSALIENVSSITWMTEESMLPMLRELVDERSIIFLNDVSPVIGVQRDISIISQIIHNNGGLLVLDYSRTCIQIPPTFDADIVLIDPSIDCLGPSSSSMLFSSIDLTATISGSSRIADISKFNITPVEGIEAFEIGQPAIPQIVATSASLQYLDKLGTSNIYTHKNQIHSHLLQRLSELQDLKIVQAEREITKSIAVTLSAPIHAHDLAILLDETNNIQVRSGSLCAQMGLEELGYDSLIQLSTHIYTSMEDIDQFIESLSKLL
ncbi:MAG: aminotransferase class V-fold PLP-dependent enzyme [Candidatus Heimdallarchaeota archaeon]|nr:aminotransferase class V-fold PLP-dependent enzyme [Candidatus Heimdallarchaeota archaeon]